MLADDQPNMGSTILRACLWESELHRMGLPKQCAKIIEFTCSRAPTTPYIFAASGVKTPFVLITMMVALSVMISRSFFLADRKDADKPLLECSSQERKFLVLHRASRECLDRQAIETVNRTLEEMVMDSMKGLSYKEIWAYEVVHLQKLRELGYKLLDFLDDLKRDTRDSHNLGATQVLTEVAMNLVLEREVRCITSLNQMTEQSFEDCGRSAALEEVDKVAIEGLYDLLEHTRMAS